MSRTDEVVDGIRTMILDGRLNAGSRLTIEKDLAVVLGVSRDPWWKEYAHSQCSAY